MLQAVETHSGIPMRVITGGVPTIPGDTVYQQMRWLEKNDDQLRLLMLREPRGYPAACCNLVVPAKHPDAAAGYIRTRTGATPSPWPAAPSFDDPSTWTGALDRCPCGTGTCAKMAVLHAKGELEPALPPRRLLGTVYTGELVDEVEIGGRPGVVPTIGGQAWISGFSTHVLDPTDPFANGFTVGDLWA